MAVPSLGLSAAIGYTLGNPEKVRDSAVYGKYLAKHKYNVIGPMRQMGLGWGQALKHDLSKLSPAEFGPYRDWFAGSKGMRGTRDPQVFSKWREAVNHHYNSPGNLHHYRKLPSTTPIADKYKLEAIADWYSVAKSNGITNQSFKEWYAANRHRLPTENHIRAEMNKQLGLTKKAEYILTKLSNKEQTTFALLEKLKGAREAMQGARIQRMVIPDEYKARDLIKTKNRWVTARQDVKDRLFRDTRN